jgi:hypothetical protein
MAAIWRITWKRHRRHRPRGCRCGPWPWTSLIMGFGQHAYQDHHSCVFACQPSTIFASKDACDWTYEVYLSQHIRQWAQIHTQRHGFSALKQILTKFISYKYTILFVLRASEYRLSYYRVKSKPHSHTISRGYGAWSRHRPSSIDEQ